MHRNSLVVAYIKELLHNFNLPMCPVYTEDTVPYRKRTYIKDHKVGSYGYNKFEPLYDFVRNHKVINLTKNLIINSSEYDEYTHNYLGEYLRFLRDYDGINLMGMYNCFFKQQPKRLKKKFMASPRTGHYYEMNVDTNDINYNYYLVPVKFNQSYTISISSPVAYEMALVIYDNQFLYDNISILEANILFGHSYKKVNQTNSNTPFLYDTYLYNRNGYTDGDPGEKLWPMEERLRLLIKMPSSISPTITILEGNWVNNSNYVGGVFIDSYKFDDDKTPDKFIGRSSLIRTNDNLQKPFANRLIEYLLHNAIDSNEFIDENIKRVQDDISIIPTGPYGIWTNELRAKLYNILYDTNLILGKNSMSGANAYSYDFDIKVEDERRLIDSYADVTGFVDKDLERQLELRSLQNG